MGFGTNTSFDTLLYADNQSVLEFGEDRAFDAIEEALMAHNQQVSEMLSELVEVTTDQKRRYGGPDAMAMEEMDEFGTPDAQKIAAGVDLGFPLRQYGIGLQWTRLYFQNARASELAAQVTAAQDADVKAIQREIKKALFLPTNYTFNDFRVSKTDIPVKRLINADGSQMPIAPDGTTFDGSTHTHYLGTASFAASNLDSGISTVNEHYLSGQIKIMINRAQEATIRGFTGFNAYVDQRIVQSQTSTYAQGGLDLWNITNRAIGIYGGAEVWVKPWIPSGYVLFLHVGGQKTLAMRTRSAGSGNLELIFEYEQYPLRSRGLAREFGIGVANRVAAAILDTANASYTAPTIS